MTYTLTYALELTMSPSPNLYQNSNAPSDHDDPKLLDGEKLGLQRRMLYAYSLHTPIRNHANTGIDRITLGPGQNCHVS